MDSSELVTNELEYRRGHVSDEALADLLTEYITFRESDYTPILEEPFTELHKEDQVLIGLLAHEFAVRKTQGELGIPAVSLIDKFELSPGAHYPYLRNLEQDGKVKRRNDNGGMYFVNSNRLEEVVSAVTESS